MKKFLTAMSIILGLGLANAQQTVPATKSTVQKIYTNLFLKKLTFTNQVNLREGFSYPTIWEKGDLLSAKYILS